MKPNSNIRSLCTVSRITRQLRCATAANTSTGANLTTACFPEGGGVTMLLWDNWQAEVFKDEE